MRIETRAVHSGHEADSRTGALVPGIQLSTTFERAGDGSYPQGYLYTRLDNPNRSALEGCVAELERGAAAVAFASGCAATMSILQTLSAGDHIVAPLDSYHGTTVVIRDIFSRWGLEASYVDMTDIEAISRALRPVTRLIWVETPSNPLLKITDLEKTAALAHRAGALLVCDNTWATPVFQQPLEWGADWVMHSTTKYLSGHSDVLGGIVVTRQMDDAWQRLRQVQTAGGAVPSPFDCWLSLRGIQTLVGRVRTQAETAGKLAQYLLGHPRVQAVHYPGLESHTGHALACRQMQGFGGMLSFEVCGGQAEAMNVAAKVKLFIRATSLGGVESLIEHRASIEGPRSTTPPGLLRLSIGLEHAEDLEADLAQALQEE